jgi:pyridoxine 4-dehydrogenase
VAGLTWREDPTPYEEAFKTMKAALAQGANFWNAGEFYGPPNANSLQLLHAYFTKYPEDASKVVLSIKGGANPQTYAPTGDKEGVTRSIETCLAVLDGTKSIDIFECARVDPKTPIEETIGYLAEFVKAGKIGGIGLSETSAKTIRRAVSVHPIAGVEVEFSLFSTDIKTNDVASTCAELKIPIVAYSPLGRGFLTSQIKSEADLKAMLKGMPRFQGENFAKNLKLADAVKEVAAKKGCTVAQLAIGWVKAQSGTPGFPTVIPIPGATTVPRVEENFKDVHVTAEDLKELDAILATFPVKGARYDEHLEALSFA